MAKKSKKSMRERIYGNPHANEFGSSVTLCGLGMAGVYNLFSRFPDAVENLKYSISNARHASNTIYDGVAGGPKGYRELRSLEDALAIVGDAAEGNNQAREALDDYVSKRRDFALELKKVYTQNETLSQSASRFKIQLEGTLKNFFEVGNSVKGETWRKIDDVIIKMYGQDPIEARERSGRLNEFYKNVKDFYDSREKNEHTVGEFCNYLKNVQETTESQNKALEELFPSLISRVKEGYEVEDVLFNTGERNFLGLRRDVSCENLAQTEQKVDKFGNRVDQTYESVAQTIPMDPYSETSFVDYVTNPLTVGLVAAATIKGATKFLPLVVEAPIRWTLATPTRLVGSVLSNAVKGGRSIKKCLFSQNQKLNKETKHSSSDKEGEMYYI
jgi:hypothetical protein